MNVGAVDVGVDPKWEETQRREREKAQADLETVSGGVVDEQQQDEKKKKAIAAKRS